MKTPMAYSVINRRNTWELENLLIKDGILQVLSYEIIKDFDQEVLLNFELKYGIYVLPTLELIDFLRGEIVGDAIEIGAGMGAIGRSLGIPITDSYLQTVPEIKFYYEQMGNPVITYPADVEKLSAESAIRKYNPDTVIAAYVTHKYNGTTGNMYGVVEGKILAKGCKYISIGNDNVHMDKPILKYPHRVMRFDWLETRSEKSKNHVKIWQ
jgi:hypothetical protein